MGFKGRAQNWDSDSRIKRAEVVAEKINEIVGDKKDISVMEYGCATGLISFNLCDKFRKLTLMDSEEEMLDVVKEKIETYQTSNIFPVLIDLTQESYTQEKFDLIFTSMTLHHILDIENIIKIFYDLLNENGILCIIDLDKEDGSFHINEKNFKGHNGFEHREIEDTLKSVGFSNIKSETFFQGQKVYEEKKISYSMFYAVGQK